MGNSTVEKVEQIAPRKFHKEGIYVKKAIKTIAY
jgi:hypothetical protein